MLSSSKTLRASWSNTLRLPKSSFPARPIVADRLKYLQQCTGDLYAWQRNAQNPPPIAGTFILHDGPPYANGPLHIGHALNKILKDITCRYQLSQGKRVDYVPGWDCHGLPIELKALQVQKDLGQLGDVERRGALAIRKAARKLATNTVEEQKKGFQDWAIMADWENAWRTMDKDFEIGQLEVFKRMVEKGLIYRRFKPVYWSPSSHTALAEGELEYKTDHISTAALVKFQLFKIPEGLRDRLERDVNSISAVIWTTTPWTLPANQAIAVNSEMDYIIVNSAKHGALLLAASRLLEVEKLCNEKFSPICTEVIHGSELIGVLYRHPAFIDDSHERRLVHADFVSADSGSGLVHVAPGHGMEDYKLCQQLGIDIIAPVDDHGRFTSEALPANPSVLAGLEVLNAGNKAVLDHLSASNAVLTIHKYAHNYPYDWRSKKPIIVRATEQWFADVEEIREAALEAMSTVEFIPEGGKERLSSFIRNRTEWCISRQRAWGVPIPALYNRDSGEALLTPESVAYIISVIQTRGIDAWWQDDEFDPLWVLPALRDKHQYRRGKDTMDVWFDSGTSWTRMGQEKNEEHSSIADLYIEGTDQHRGWFQSSLLTKIACQETRKNGGALNAPYKTLITHGFALDQYGKKMSKSVGNVISANEVMDATLLPPIKTKWLKGNAGKDQRVVYDAMGADALRLWVAGCDYTRDIVVGKSVLKAVNSNLSKLRVTFRLLLGMLDTHTTAHRIDFKLLGTIDQLALIQLRRLNDNVWRAYQKYEYHKVVSAINQYVASDISAFYIECIKDRMYADAPQDNSRICAQIVLWEIFKHLSSMLAPITPLLVAEACDYLPKTLHFHPVKDTWSEQGLPTCVDGVWQNEQLERDLPYLTATNTAIKATQEFARIDKKMGSSLQSYAYLEIQPGQDSDAAIAVKHIFERHKLALQDFFVVSHVGFGVATHPQHFASVDWLYKTEYEVQGMQITAFVHSPLRGKCDRCWKYDVEEQGEKGMPGPLKELCSRCDQVVRSLEWEKEKA